MAAKKKVVIEIKSDPVKKAHREARATVGVVKASRVVEERQAETKKPKHKKKLTEDE